MIRFNFTPSVVSSPILVVLVFFFLSVYCVLCKVWLQCKTMCSNRVFDQNFLILRNFLTVGVVSKNGTTCCEGKKHGWIITVTINQIKLCFLPVDFHS